LKRNRDPPLSRVGSWDENDATTPLALVIVSRDHGQECYEFSKLTSPSNEEDAGRMLPRRAVIGNLADHGFFVGGHHDPASVFGP
jgi:hypothetical protein